eukprot:NODE_14_length_42432_cov_0.433799.p8 type:complete len:490 gc:universal NODE_14_length_42432_cov_0.433799:1736-267(-)
MKRALLWLRRDLRLKDNLALNMVKDAHELIPLYIVENPQHTKVGPNRWLFLQQCLEDLDAQLQKRDSKLFVARGNAYDVLKSILSEWEITHLAFDELTEPHAVERDSNIISLSESLNVKVITTQGKLLYHPPSVIAKNDGKLPKTYSSFIQVCSRLPAPPRPLDICNIPPLPNISFSGDYSIFKLDEFCSAVPTTAIKGGEIEALRLLDLYCKDKRQTTRFEKPKTSPTSFEPASTTTLSPHTTWGCLSARDFYWRVMDLVQNDRMSSQPPVSLVGQLLWRDFFHSQGYAIPNFSKMNGNPVCLQVQWDDNESFLSSWTNAKTGYPFIDAIMTQLRTEGWIHHLARHAVACFLTRGDLYISWEQGLLVFQELLLDHDWNLNAGNWLWLSASAYFSSYFKVYSPIAFGKKYDKSGEYIKKYVPQLKNYPARYVYQPWEATKEQQKKWGCVIGVDYPKPIVDHKIASDACKNRMKEAYHNKSYKIGDKRKL